MSESILNAGVGDFVHLFRCAARSFPQRHYYGKVTKVFNQAGYDARSDGDGPLFLILTPNNKEICFYIDDHFKYSMNRMTEKEYMLAALKGESIE